MNRATYSTVQFGSPTSQYTSDTGQPSFSLDDTTDSESHPKIRITIQNNNYRVVRPFQESNSDTADYQEQPAIDQAVDDAVNNAIYGEALNR